MKTIKGFVKKYWITVLIFAGLVLLYYYVADVKMLNPYLFPTTEKIAAAYVRLSIRSMYSYVRLSIDRCTATYV